MMVVALLFVILVELSVLTWLSARQGRLLADWIERIQTRIEAMEAEFDELLAMIRAARETDREESRIH